MSTAVHFGAGNIGRGFLGQLYHASGYNTVFIDVVDAVVTALQERHGYPIHIVSNAGTDVIAIDHVDAVDGKDMETAAQTLASADIASTAVGVNVLPKVAPTIARAIELRFAADGAAPLNLLVCENLIGAGAFLREEVRKHLAPALHGTLDGHVGFVEVSIGRMVPVSTTEDRAKDPLLVRVEPYCELPVDATGFRGAIPAIAHLQPKENFAAYVERKLFVHNMSHAATAYLGHLRGHEFIWQAEENASVREVVAQAMHEACEGLHRKHGLDRAELDAYADDLLDRYQNHALGDRVDRVARDPLRKLGNNDRIIGAMRMCASHEVVPEAIALAAAAAIRYDDPDDPASLELQRRRMEDGVNGILREVCGLNPQDPVAMQLLHADRLLEANTQPAHEQGPHRGDNHA